MGMPGPTELIILLVIISCCCSEPSVYRSWLKVLGSGMREFREEQFGRLRRGRRREQGRTKADRRWRRR